MQIAPTALFVYNRLEHTKRVIEALQKNVLASESDLIIFSDGPKHEKDVKKIDEVRKYLKTIDGFKSIEIFEKENNLGLSNSIISGVTEVVNRYGKIIVLEDDLVVSPYFLEFMNNALVKYENEEKVISIHGYIYPIKNKLPETFFIKGADCWGWATWKRGWDLFEPNGQKLLDELLNKNLTKAFDFNGSYPYILMLRSQIKGFNSSWAIRWYASAFLADKLTLYPGESSVVNIGFDKSGVHTGKNRYFDVSINKSLIELKDIPIVENLVAKKFIQDYFSSFRMILTKISMRLNFLIKFVKKGL